MQARAANRQSAWRKLRQRVRVLWRWMVVRTVRNWFRSRTRTEVGADSGEVKQFPQSRWP